MKTGDSQKIRSVLLLTLLLYILFNIPSNIHLLAIVRHRGMEQWRNGSMKTARQKQEMVTSQHCQPFPRQIFPHRKQF